MTICVKNQKSIGCNEIFIFMSEVRYVFLFHNLISNVEFKYNGKRYLVYALAFLRRVVRKRAMTAIADELYTGLFVKH